ncbi:MAG: carboxypeptidase regulatory-like domain-containing protein [Bacteroidaceae bacterium]|nr:carboxypeptidase regulatory-like domain-containing protein [Bacteroidaceae bacterium]
MKTEDIDKKIGMPDVDAEWARFEREVINKENARPKRVAAWAAGIGIAASIALMLVVGGQDQTRTQPPLPSPLKGGSGYLTRTEGEASSLTHSTSPFDGARKTEQGVPAGVVREREQEKRASDIDVESLQDDSEETSWSSSLNQQIKGLTIVSSSSSLGPGNTMRLAGTRINHPNHVEGWDSTFTTPLDPPIRSLTIVSSSSELGPGHTMRLGHPCPKVVDLKAMRPSLQGQIAGLTDSIVYIPSDSIRQGASASDSILYMVNGLVDPDFNAFQREEGKSVAPDFNFATSAYLFDKNQLLIRYLRTELRQDSAKDESTTKEKAIKMLLDAQTVPFKPTREMTPSEIKSRQTAYLQKTYRARVKGETHSDAYFSPDLFGSTAEERLFGLLTLQCGDNSIHEAFGPMASDSHGIYVPLVRDVTLRGGDRAWFDKGRIWVVKDDPQCDAVIRELRQAAGLADSHVEFNDSVVKLAMMSGGRVTAGEPHPFNTHMQSALSFSYLNKKYSSLDQSVFYFKPEADAPSYWWAEAYYSTRSRRSVAVHLHAVYKLYAADCPDLLANRRFVEGRVVNEQGQPLADARVSFGTLGSFGPEISTQADADGRFSFWMPFRDAPIWVLCWDYKIVKVQPADSSMTIRMKAFSLITPELRRNINVEDYKGLKGKKELKGIID